MGIKCPKCHSDNTDTARFCSSCATPLPSPEIPVTETLETPTEELTRGTTFAGRYEIIAALAFLFFKGGKEATPPENKMLVFLPIENLGPPVDEYFADGITDEFTNRLSALHGLDVISRTSAIQYKKSEKNEKYIRKAVFYYEKYLYLGGEKEEEAKELLKSLE